ncbi:MAG: DegT/DnrJ/EryC1/StrS family aminotransferase [Planctomycetes bacterium]|nr:DegT/DnrJ/EryC1/StrS family aminotransferase [Planctomycetota bacterium]
MSPEIHSNIPWWQPETGPRELHLIEEVLRSNFLNDGQYTQQFEKELAQRLGCKHVIAVTSGTAALFVSLAGLGLGMHDEVLVPDVTFIATANAVTLTGAKPILVDIDPATLTIDPESIRQAITSKTKAVIPVHISGRAADLSAITAIADEHSLYVIEDAAQALMSKHHGKSLGTIGHAGCFSFSPMKTITTGQGGAVATNDDQLHARIRELKDQGRPARGTGGNDLHPTIGYNFKLTNLQAAIGLAQLETLNDRINRLKKIYRIYNEQLSDQPKIKLIGFDLDSGESPQWIDCLAENRDELVESLRENQIDSRPYWYPLHTQEPYRQPDHLFPHSTQQTEKALWLPSSITMTDDDLDRVCRTIRKFYNTAASSSTKTKVKVHQ